ncbi:iron complex outermembrane receptor protein [Marinoscillum furvescens DSM 4134]|uniref:Iron complex outermembrane receptor protein n=1 Tax=Marinoscillum furvescens DSM 4134 TaxID=1122208 RepID=A0A3D9L4H6_MARFU|nr:iron complex outermembrane receptor protein [Marinoscillum furvescens DSM 4134]
MAYAQEADTLYLQAVEVADVERYAQERIAGQLDSLTLEPFRSSSIGDALQQSTGVYIKQYGAEGQLSSITLRGTTSSQTRLSWHGIDINSQTLGQSDFSSTPTFLFSDITVHQGASSALFGSGSIGGTVQLKSGSPNQGALFNVRQEVGSFGKVFSGMKASLGNAKRGLSLAAVNSIVQNDFEVAFRNETYKQNNAASDLKAIKLNGFYRMAGGGRLTADVWYNYHFREIQPIIGDQSGEDQLRNVNWRTYLSYDQSVNSGYIKSGLAVVIDHQQYNESSPTNLKRFIWDGYYEYLGSELITYRLGADIELALPDVGAYENNTRQWRYAPHAFAKFTPLNEFSATANLRVPYQSNQKAVPVIPSLDLTYAVVTNQKITTKVGAQVARAFRFPTLNDLYWQPGGNLNLKPEDGVAAELGLDFAWVKGNLDVRYQIDHYRSWLSEMIVWLPADGYWSPDNAQDVHLTGVENALKVNWTFSEWQFGLSSGHTFNRSVNEAGFMGNESSNGKQLPYVPKHKWNARVQLARGGWSVDLRAAHTGKRYTEASNTSEIDAYSLYDAHFSKQLSWNSHELVVGASVKNIWDTAYQNYELRATPGRNYLFKLNYIFN